MNEELEEVQELPDVDLEVGFALSEQGDIVFVGWAVPSGRSILKRPIQFAETVGEELGIHDAVISDLLLLTDEGLQEIFLEDRIIFEESRDERPRDYADFLGSLPGTGCIDSMIKKEITTTMTPPATEKKTYANTQGFTEIDADGFTVMGDRILVQWLQAHDEFKAGKITLARPETHKAAHFTGTILGVGPRVDLDVKKGMRLLFQQFAGFEKLFDPKYGRMALIRASDAMAILPSRVKVENMDGDYDYDA